MALSDNQISFNGVTMGFGTAYRIKQVSGIRGQAPLQTNDTPKLTVDGVFAGYDTQVARIIDASVVVTGTSASNFESHLAALEVAMAPLLNSTLYLNWKLPSLAEKKILCRPRKCTPPVLPTYSRLWLQVELEWVAPDPAIQAGP